ncbi:MAG: hypothetical protein Q8Q09_22850 [Deltaproteobacteria bacterium]|nr:hypothetical protein [Deltaproteobacteria bacterium]
MLIRSIGVLGLASLSAFSTCFGAGGRGTTARAGENSPIQTFTDSDVITGVTQSATDVWVGTQRGVLKYPANGGNPVRFTTRDGLPSDVVFAIGSDLEGTVWAATATGVAKFNGSRFELAGHAQAQPNVGRPTAVLALAGGNALVGGAQGIARWDGTSWSLLTDRYQVMSFYMDLGKPMVATAQHGVLAVRPDFAGVDEFGSTTGIPDALVRSVVGAGDGKFWALAQGANGSKLLYHNGTHWTGYTSATARSPWIGLVSLRGTPTLITRDGAFEIRTGAGDELAVLTADITQPMAARRVAFVPQVLVPPPPPPPPVVVPPPTTRRGRRVATPAARPHKPTAALSAAPVDAPALFAQVTASTQNTARLAQSRPDAGPAVTDASAQASAGGLVAPRMPPPVATVQVADGGAPDAAPDAAPVAAAAPAAPREVAPAPRNIPDFAGPVDVPPPGPSTDAPRFGLVASAARLPADTLAPFATRDGLFVSRVGLGISRVAGGEATDFRAHDLAMSRRPLSLATDTQGSVWFVSEDGGAVKFDGRRFSRATLDPEGVATPLMFWSRGTTVVAVGRVGPNTLRTYRWSRDHWQQVTERPVDTRGPGTIDVKFLTVDERSRYWMGVRVVDRPSGQSNVEMGVAMIDESVPSAIQFHHEVPPQGAEFGAVPVPSDLTAADFDGDGNLWFAGLSGATRLTPPTAPGGAYVARTYNEATGLRGDLVSDLARGLNGRVFVATSEGLGYWSGERFAFDVEGSRAQPRVSALTVDNNGGLWGAGQRGAWAYDGQRFRTFGQSTGLPTDAFVDIAVDAENRVWFVTAEGITIFTQSQTASAGSSQQGQTN